MATLKDALSPENLNAAWYALRKDKATWQTGLSRREMEQHALQHILRLRDDIENGHYRPAPVRRFTLRTRSGKERGITALQLRDKLAQRAVLQVLQPEWERTFHPDSFGYRKGRGRELAVARVKTLMLEGYPHVILTDIRDCFDTIPLKPLKALVRKRIADPGLCALVCLWIDAHATERPRLGPARGIPQGGILSPLLCNLYLNELDTWLARKKVPFVRYADDVVLCLPSEASRKRWLRKLDRKLARMGLAPGNKRERCPNVGWAFEYLGMRIRVKPQSVRSRKPWFATLV